MARPRAATQIVLHRRLWFCEPNLQDNAKSAGTGEDSFARADARAIWVARTLERRRA